MGTDNATEYLIRIAELETENRIRLIRQSKLFRLQSFPIKCTNPKRQVGMSG